MGEPAASADGRTSLVTPQDKAFFEANGYVRLSGMIDDRSCSALIDEIWKLMPERFDRADPSSWTGRIQDCVNFLPTYQRKGLIRFKDKHGFGKQPTFRAAIHDNPAFSDVFQDMLGLDFEKVTIRGLHPNLPMPRWISVNEAIGNRLDRQMTRPERPLFKIPRPPQAPIFGHLDAHPAELQMIAYLDDVADDGGGLMVWPGSHRLFRLAFESRVDFLPTGFYKRCVNLLQRYKPTVLGGRRGDVIVFNNRLMHANTVNTSKNVRYGVLLDLYGKGWRERDAAARADDPDAAQRKLFNATKRIETLPLVQEVLAGYQPDKSRAFWLDHPKLLRLSQSVWQDPIGADRRMVSSKIRARAVGDCWIVVSQRAAERASRDLNASGAEERGDYALWLNGEKIAKSVGGVLVHPLKTRPCANEVKLEGRFGVEHYVRFVQTRSPVAESVAFATGVVPAGASAVTFDVSPPPLPTIPERVAAPDGPRLVAS